MESLTIRPARIDDVPALARVHVDSARAVYRELVPESSLKGYTYPRREERFREAIRAGSEETYIAQIGQDIVGILTIGAARDPDLDSGRVAEIWGIYIAPAYWRKGVGRRLVQEAELIFLFRGYGEAVLWVLEDNLQAKRFYEAMGFHLDGESKDIEWGTIVRAVRYRKSYD